MKTSNNVINIFPFFASIATLFLINGGYL